MFDFLSFVRDNGIPHKEEGQYEGRRYIQTHCPFCTDGTRGWHLGYNIGKGYFNCWRCGSIKILSVLRALLHSEKIAKAMFRKYQTDFIPIEAPKPKINPRKRKLWTPPGIGPMKNAHRRYLQRRGFNPEKLEELWDLQGTAHLSGRAWSWRIVFPINNADGETMAYCGRTIRDIEPKYRMPANDQLRADPREVIYGLQYCTDTVVIVEGPADVWKFGPGAVATLGIDWTREQAVILKDYRRRFIIFDPEPEAQKRAVRLAFWLSMYDGNVELVTELGSDPGDLPQREADAIMKQLLEES